MCVKKIAFELELFGTAKNWKRYWAETIRRHVSGSVVEVGAGLGTNAAYLMNRDVDRLILLEPDPDLFSKLSKTEFPKQVGCKSGVLRDLNETFDTIIYVDVLEHIEFDLEETMAAYERMNKGAHLVILVPALQFLYSPFDQAVGHYRRYSRTSLRSAVDPRLETVSETYLDSIGLLASIANKLLLRSSSPTRRQIDMWDRMMIRVSTVIDPLLLYSVGKTVVGVYRKP